ncbi:MAG: cobaltochelatase subunit CobS, partial [Planctomycetes bacterium]|nr:cobaltochelatase subunit CobS [Planctomycetota bacterium]
MASSSGSGGNGSNGLDGAFKIGVPDIHISVRQAFGIDADMEVPAFSETCEHVPDVDDAY